MPVMWMKPPFLAPTLGQSNLSHSPPQAGSGAQMNEERITQFTEEVAELKLRGAKGDNERWLLLIGSLMLVVGVALGVVGGAMASGTTNTADQVAAIATGSLVGLVLVIAGTALFLRYSMGRFIRFWMVRFVHEQRTETDRLIAAIEKSHK